MNLKIDYKDAIFEGVRRYTLSNNEDKTISLIDSTTYIQEGDKFGANDINSTNKEINKLKTVTEIVLLAAGWSASAPYIQTVNVEGMAENDRPHISLYISEETTAEEEKILKKAMSCISFINTADGNITATCLGKKPTVDFQISIKGV